MKPAIAILTLFAAQPLMANLQPVECKPDKEKGTASVTIGGQPFTTLHFKGYAKPILHPIIGTTGLNLVREWPVKDAAPNEELDHPHHKGLWFTHGAVNGVDFWKEAPDAGKIIVTGEPKIERGHNDSTVTITTQENWMAPGDKKTLTSTTVLTGGWAG